MAERYTLIRLDDADTPERTFDDWTRTALYITERSLESWQYTVLIEENSEDELRRDEVTNDDEKVLCDMV